MPAGLAEQVQLIVYPVEMADRCTFEDLQFDPRGLYSCGPAGLKQRGDVVGVFKLARRHVDAKDQVGAPGLGECLECLEGLRDDDLPDPVNERRLLCDGD